MTDLHLDTGAYVLDALDDVERRSMERHLHECDSCAAEVADFRETTALLAERVAVPPPAVMRLHVMTRVSRARQVAPGPRPRRPRLVWRPLAAAAAVLIAAGVGVGGVVHGHQVAGDAQSQADAIVRVLTAPDRVQVSKQMSGGGRATVAAYDDTAVLALADMPAAPSGHDYQVWVMHGDDPARSVGLATLEAGSTQLLIDDVPHGYEVGISVEPTGGSKQPTTAPVLAVEV
ncbi:anti-sigma factor domain-containing protein [Spongisporangium articulatum]|uniref:Regulator of SigK n=1 Tax=Spongisporangium articulatum TaxID=3362603 RepID=A0ABW8AME0_9ACTN